MARTLHKGNPDSPHSYERKDSETVSWDGASYRTAKLVGEEVGMSPEELLEYAVTQLREYESTVNKLLRHVPRKLEEKVKRVHDPNYRAREAIQAVGILIANARRPLEGTKDE